jgi:hypothetical protein
MVVRVNETGRNYIALAVNGRGGQEAAGTADPLS